MEWWLTIASIRSAVVCLILFLLFRVLSNRKPNGRISPAIRTVWLTGALLSLIHALATMGYAHHWSHQAAFADTAERTESLIGLSVGAGIYFNYLFVLLWLADAIWLLVSPVSYAQRNRWITTAVYGYLLFIGFNGAVVFVTGWFRWWAAGLFAVLTVAWLLRQRRPDANNGPETNNGQE